MVMGRVTADMLQLTRLKAVGVAVAKSSTRVVSNRLVKKIQEYTPVKTWALHNSTKVFPFGESGDYQMVSAHMSNLSIGDYLMKFPVTKIVQGDDSAEYAAAVDQGVLGRVYNYHNLGGKGGFITGVGAHQFQRAIRDLGAWWTEIDFKKSTETEYLPGRTDEKQKIEGITYE